MLIVVLTGCTKNSSNPTGSPGSQLSASDKATLDNLIGQDSLLVGDVASMDDGGPSSLAALAKADTAIIPVAWGRTFSSWVRNKTYNQIDDSTVIATITNALTGKLWIWSKGGVITQKPITVNTTRNVKFVKSTRDSTRWVLRYVSCMQGTTTSTTDVISITDAKFSIGADTVEITAPPKDDYLLVGGSGRYGLHVMGRDLVRKFTVTATVISSAPDSDLVVVHHPNDQWERVRNRMALVSSAQNGDGTYTRVYQFTWHGDFPGRHNILITAFTRKSIYDNQAAVTSEGWGIPYIVN